jgi:DNA-binding PadR family transcriptional regulator
MSTRLLVLGVVRIFQPVHGYDVRRELVSWRADQWANASMGSIYNALKSLTRDGLLEVVGTDQVGARPERTTYRLTGEGEREFQSLLREAMWTVSAVIDPLLPALSFLPAMRREEAIAALEHRIASIEGQLRSFQYAIDDHKGVDDPSSPPHVPEMFRLMSARMASELDWARAVIDKLKSGQLPMADDPDGRYPKQSKARALDAAGVPFEAEAKARTARTTGKPARKPGERLAIVKENPGKRGRPKRRA